MGTRTGSSSLPTPHAYWANGPDHHQPNTLQYQQLRINAAASEIARAKGERHLPGSYRLVTNDVYRARFLYAPLPIGAPIGTIPLMVPGGLVKSSNPPTSSDATSYGFPTTQALPGSTSQNPPIIRRPTPPVALGASKHTAAPTRFKSSYMVNHPAFHAPFAIVITTTDILPETKTIMSAPKTSRPETKTIMPAPKTRTPETKTTISTPKTSISTPETITYPSEN